MHTDICISIYRSHPAFPQPPAHAAEVAGIHPACAALRGELPTFLSNIPDMAIVSDAKMVLVTTAYIAYLLCALFVRTLKVSWNLVIYIYIYVYTHATIYPSSRTTAVRLQAPVRSRLLLRDGVYRDPPA